MWKDLTVDYVTGIVHSEYESTAKRPRCAILASSFGWLGIVRCTDSKISNSNDGFICQYPDATSGPNIQTPAPSPSLAKINVTTIGHNGGQWRPVHCRSGHVTHTFLACDVATFCWTEGKFTVSLRPETWALPMSQSCPAKLTSLPPSFLCQSEKQHVPYTLVCDHRLHCLDSSDEKFCKYPPCQIEFQFQCLNKQVSSECFCLYRAPVQYQGFISLSCFFLT